MNEEVWMYILLVFAVSIISIMLYRKIVETQILKSDWYKKEGFSQNEPLVYKKNQDVYDDDFYAKTYDKINLPNRRVPRELKIIIDTTMATIDNSVILDIGSGTGYTVNELNDLGFRAFGIDKSSAMVQYSKQRYDSIPVKVGDVENQMTFDRSSFSHTLCLYFTIYDFEEKRTLFKNCYYWLKPGGYLVIHLVDKDNFDTTIPAKKDIIFGSPQRYEDKRITDQMIRFADFQYKSTYEFNTSSPNVYITESFTDSSNEKIRENERVLYMNDIQEILNLATLTGFIPQGKIKLKETDEHQYLYFLERPNSL